jgi:hypothetical protein
MAFLICMFVPMISLLALALVAEAITNKGTHWRPKKKLQFLFMFPTLVCVVLMSQILIKNNAIIFGLVSLPFDGFKISMLVDARALGILWVFIVLSSLAVFLDQFFFNAYSKYFNFVLALLVPIVVIENAIVSAFFSILITILTAFVFLSNSKQFFEFKESVKFARTQLIGDLLIFISLIFWSIINQEQSLVFISSSAINGMKMIFWGGILLRASYFLRAHRVYVNFTLPNAKLAQFFITLIMQAPILLMIKFQNYDHTFSQLSWILTGGISLMILASFYSLIYEKDNFAKMRVLNFVLFGSSIILIVFGFVNVAMVVFLVNIVWGFIFTFNSAPVFISDSELYLIKISSRNNRLHIVGVFVRKIIRYMRGILLEVVVPMYFNFFMYRMFKIFIALVNLPLKIVNNGNLGRSVIMVVISIIIYGYVWRNR